MIASAANADAARTRPFILLRRIASLSSAPAFKPAHNPPRATEGFWTEKM
jgi:hypothetical protein